MMNSSKNVLKARCENTGLLIRLLFWAYALYLFIMMGIGLYMISRPEGDFTIRLLDTGNGLAGYGFYYQNLEVDFARNTLTENAVNAPKLVYLIGYFCGFAVKVPFLIILWCIADIFKRIDRNDSPFVKRSCRIISRIGVLVIASGLLRYGLTPMLLGLLGYSKSGGDSSYLGYLLTGAVIICFSYIFEYGTSLQIESDETL